MDKHLGIFREKELHEKETQQSDLNCEKMDRPKKITEGPAQREKE